MTVPFFKPARDPVLPALDPDLFEQICCSARRLRRKFDNVKSLGDTTNSLVNEAYCRLAEAGSLESGDLTRDLKLWTATMRNLLLGAFRRECVRGRNLGGEGLARLIAEGTPVEALDLELATAALEELSETNPIGADVLFQRACLEAQWAEIGRRHGLGGDATRYVYRKAAAEFASGLRARGLADWVE